MSFSGTFTIFSRSNPPSSVHFHPLSSPAEPGSCPVAYPYGYDKGTKCCRTNEKCATVNYFSYEGSCCKTQNVQCKYGKCRNRLSGKNICMFFIWVGGEALRCMEVWLVPVRKLRYPSHTLRKYCTILNQTTKWTS